MEIELRVARSDGGRLTGTAEAAGMVLEFSGTMELLAVLERLCATAADTGPA